jgi:molecular chaperone DnaK (HSP70)
MEVLGTAGDASLGGNDIDARLADWLLQEAAARGPLPVDAKGWAMAAAEAAKIALATADSAEVALPGGGAPIVLTTECFEELTAGLFQLMANVLEALGEALFVEWAVKPSLAVPGRAAASSLSNSGSTNSGSSSPSSNGSADTSEAGSSRAEGSGSSSGKDRWAPPPRRITQVALVGQVTRLPSVQRFVHRVTGEVLHKHLPFLSTGLRRAAWLACLLPKLLRALLL